MTLNQYKNVGLIIYSYKISLFWHKELNNYASEYCTSFIVVVSISEI